MPAEKLKTVGAISKAVSDLIKLFLVLISVAAFVRAHVADNESDEAQEDVVTLEARIDSLMAVIDGVATADHHPETTHHVSRHTGLHLGRVLRGAEHGVVDAARGVGGAVEHVLPGGQR